MTSFRETLVERLSQVSFTSAAILIAAIWLATATAKVIRWRLYIRKLRAQGLPMPPHSFLLGHLPIINEVIRGLPKDAHAIILPDEIRRRYPELGPNYYVDLMPFAPSMLILGSTETHYQLAHEHLLKKTTNLREYVRPLTNGLDMLTMEPADWKRWRGIFNPGFSAAHLMTLVPAIVEETKAYCKVLDSHVEKQDVFAMKTLTDHLTLDIIGRVAMGVHFNCQLKANKVIESFRTQIRWFRFGTEPNLLWRYNPLQPLVQWYHARIVDTYVAEQFDSRAAMYVDESHDQQDLRKTRTIMDLAISAFDDDRSQQISGSPKQRAILDPFFRRVCMSQIKLFMFSGHDTTSSTICYNLYLLFRNPNALEQIRKEHDLVFGSDLVSAANIISASPHLLNQLPYTTAVIKESLRLYTPLTPSRQGEVGFSVADRSGRSFPTGDFLVLPSTQVIHHYPEYWPEPDKFLPERWLAGPDDVLYPIKGAWRGFEHGPRNCIGQELAMLEMKVVLVLVCRRYNIKPAYDQFDTAVGRKSPQIRGETAYQADNIHPRGDLPVMVEYAAARNVEGD